MESYLPIARTLRRRLVRKQARQKGKKKRMLVQIEDLKVGDVISSPILVRAMKQEYYNHDLERAEFCPSKPKIVVSAGDLDHIPERRKSLDNSRAFKEYEVRLVAPKNKFVILRHKDTRERLSLKFGFPAVELLSRLSEEDYKRRLEQIAVRDARKKEQKKKAPSISRYNAYNPTGVVFDPVFDDDIA